MKYNLRSGFAPSQRTYPPISETNSSTVISAWLMIDFIVLGAKSPL
jgi:hypothetical protein